MATNLGLHKLGEDRARMPPKDIGVRPGSLAHREQAVRVWWELVTQVRPRQNRTRCCGAD